MWSYTTSLSLNWREKNLKAGLFGGYVFDWMYSCSQRITVSVSVQMESSDKRCPSRVHLWVLPFSTFINNLGSGIECILSMFDEDTKQSGAVDTVKDIPSKGTQTILKSEPK